jgi:hypothetical protein
MENKYGKQVVFVRLHVDDPELTETIMDMGIGDFPTLRFIDKRAKITAQLKGCNRTKILQELDKLVASK